LGIEIKALASGSTGNAYWVTDGQTPVLLECGIPIKKIREGCDFRLHEIEACFVSHGHMDHYKSAKDIINAGIDLFLSPETSLMLGLSSHRLKEISAGQQVKVGTWIVRAFKTEHDIDGSLGFLLHSIATGERLVYITDSFFSRYVFKGITHFMLEINYDMQTLNENVADGIVPLEMKNRLLRSHFSLENAVAFLKANDLSKVRGIWVIHSSDGNSNIDRIKTTIQKATGKPVFIC